VLLPWVARNYARTGAAGISSVAAFNFFHYNVPEFLATKEGITPDQARLRLEKEVPFPPSSYADLARSKALMKVALGYIRANPIAYAQFYVIKTVPLFLSSSLENIFYSYNAVVGKEVFATNNVNMTGLIMKRDWHGLFSALKKFPLLTGEQLLLALAGLFGLLALLRKESHFATFLFLAIIAYFALLTGPVAYARFRTPFEPFWFVLAAVGFSASIGRVWQRKTPQKVATRLALSSPRTMNQPLLANSSKKFLPPVSPKASPKR
jgi:hypothetical protein